MSFKFPSTANDKFEHLERCNNRDIIKNQKRFLKLGAWQCCLNCVSFSNGICQKFNQTPPDDVKILGCDNWSSAVIPF